MPSSLSSPSPVRASVVSVPAPWQRSLARSVSLVLLAALAPLGCDELNPDFDPDGGPVCSPGMRRCDPETEQPQVCQAATSWTTLSPCFVGSGCSEGLCLPGEPFLRCDSVADCSTAGDLCTVFVDPEELTHLGTFCVPPPNPGGRPGGQACTLAEDCASGYCFRRVCFEACSDASQCTNTGHDCAPLDVTVDGVRDAGRVKGCVPPQDNQ